MCLWFIPATMGPDCLGTPVVGDRGSVGDARAHGRRAAPGDESGASMTTLVLHVGCGTEGGDAQVRPDSFVSS